MRVAAFLLGVAVGWLLRRRPAPRPAGGWRVDDADVTLLPWRYRTTWNSEPMARRAEQEDGYMHVSWMQADGTWTWAGL